MWLQRAEVHQLRPRDWHGFLLLGGNIPFLLRLPFLAHLQCFLKHHPLFRLPLQAVVARGPAAVAVGIDHGAYAHFAGRQVAEAEGAVAMERLPLQHRVAAVQHLHHQRVRVGIGQVERQGGVVLGCEVDGEAVGRVAVEVGEHALGDEDAVGFVGAQGGIDTGTKAGAVQP